MQLPGSSACLIVGPRPPVCPRLLSVCLRACLAVCLSLSLLLFYLLLSRPGVPAGLQHRSASVQRALPCPPPKPIRLRFFEKTERHGPSTSAVPARLFLSEGACSCNHKLWVTRTSLYPAAEDYNRSTGELLGVRQTCANEGDVCPCGDFAFRCQDRAFASIRASICESRLRLDPAGKTLAHQLKRQDLWYFALSHASCATG